MRPCRISARNLRPKCRLFVAPVRLFALLKNGLVSVTAEGTLQRESRLSSGEMPNPRRGGLSSLVKRCRRSNTFSGRSFTSGSKIQHGHIYTAFAKSHLAGCPFREVIRTSSSWKPQSYCGYSGEEVAYRSRCLRNSKCPADKFELSIRFIVR